MSAPGVIIDTLEDIQAPKSTRTPIRGYRGRPANKPGGFVKKTSAPPPDIGELINKMFNESEEVFQQKFKERVFEAQEEEFNKKQARLVKPRAVDYSVEFVRNLKKNKDPQYSKYFDWDEDDD